MGDKSVVSHSPQPLAAADGPFVDAHLMRSPECRRDIEATQWEKDWLPSNTGRSKYNPHMGSMQSTMRCCHASCKGKALKKCCLRYVRNQKAGSNFMVTTLQYLFPQLHCVNSSKAAYSHLPFSSDSRDPSPKKNGDFIFTVVREPIACAVDGFAEVDRRHRNHPRYHDINCETCPNCRYRAFLEGIAEHEALGTEFFHAYPQTIKVGTALGPFDAVVRLERFNEGLEAIAARMNTTFKALPASERKNVRPEIACWKRINFESDPDLLRTVCSLYSSDFTCFGYERPPLCASVQPAQQLLCQSGIRSGNYCCAKACGRCGGQGCGSRFRDSSNQCCFGAIGKSGRICRAQNDTGCVITVPAGAPSDTSRVIGAGSDSV